MWRRVSTSKSSKDCGEKIWLWVQWIWNHRSCLTKCRVWILSQSFSSKGGPQTSGLRLRTTALLCLSDDTKMLGCYLEYGSRHTWCPSHEGLVLLGSISPWPCRPCCRWYEDRQFDQTASALHLEDKSKNAHWHDSHMNPPTCWHKSSSHLWSLLSAQWREWPDWRAAASAPSRPQGWWDHRWPKPEPEGRVLVSTRWELWDIVQREEEQEEAQQDRRGCESNWHLDWSQTSLTRHPF